MKKNRTMPSKKYYIVFYNKKTQEKQYYKYKCLEKFVPSKFGCWKFSKQGATKIIERLKYEFRQNPYAEFYLEEADI